MTFHDRAFAGAIELKDAEGDDAAGIVTKALEELRGSIDDRLKAVETKADASALVTRLDKLEARLNRPAVVTDKSDDVERKAFMSFARRGVERMDDVERKALTVAVDTAGGFLAPEIFASELIKLTTEFSPIRAYANVVNVAGDSIVYPRRTGTTSATWVGETEDRTASQPAYEQITLANHELATYTDVSTKLLEDNQFNLEGELQADFAENFGKTEGLAFVKGTGVGQPKGLMTATGIAEVKTGAASAFPASNPADVLIGMYHKLPTVHAQRGAWVMNRNTLAEIRKWKDGQGRYLIVDPISEGAATTLLGRPIVEMLDMADIAANAYPIVFGDLSGFRIVDRIGLSLLRDPYTLATKGQVRFHARKRTGSDVTHPDRFVKLKVAA
ncbi:phage major capsid protein [Chelatococcus sambhunathii]|uniref:Phage major capsid protein n=1 Tax=Chelatococcus sambhunathii TaxID=363953 RepID=A0ABU1DEM5_9HYPH|nr:phage major capsid protein [Chelatococcus sambhunathii]MDR4306573.1 phage major capsid protein [Chelatococcus sambhunathii]